MNSHVFGHPHQRNHVNSHVFYCFFAYLQVLLVFYVVFEAVKQADFAHAVEAMRLHEVTERSRFEGVEIFHVVASQISSSTLDGSIEQQGSFLLKKTKKQKKQKLKKGAFQWMRVNGSPQRKIEAFFAFSPFCF